MQYLFSVLFSSVALSVLVWIFDFIYFIFCLILSMYSLPFVLNTFSSGTAVFVGSLCALLSQTKASVSWMNILLLWFWHIGWNTIVHIDNITLAPLTLITCLHMWQVNASGWSNCLFQVTSINWFSVLFFLAYLGFFNFLASIILDMLIVSGCIGYNYASVFPNFLVGFWCCSHAMVCGFFSEPWPILSQIPEWLELWSLHSITIKGTNLKITGHSFDFTSSYGQ